MRWWLQASTASLVYSTFLGGQGNNLVNGIAVDAQDDAYVAGLTNATDFPVVHPFESQPRISDVPGKGPCPLR